ncbi:unnamed protein product [Rotaria sp. Silwood2]|nr:unnamed protein product [Rotaria sp. Silwood2]CAF2924904.1 unnamed protein product [Rotaria sp. Silwood2]CAF3188568.1 unnamed protein product [Rotaria sp. Silwood2]CAF3325527.1 unnamed protein product [Rotaria sp. Silwood2]CAF4057942.1 unnamed protein product [Rotaria sp. Silwood2]
MSSLPVHRYRRGSNDKKFTSDTFGNDFELFDPWTDNNLSTPTSFRWINQPKRKKEHEDKIAPALLSPTYGEKFRVKLDISCFDPETIKTTIEGRLLIIEAKKKHHHSNSENTKEQKIYDLPETVYEHADADHLVSYVTPNNLLIVDIPLCNREHEQRYLQSSSKASHSHHLLPYGQYRDQSFNYHHFHTSAFAPKVVDGGEHKRKLQMSLPMKNYRPEHIKVSVKNNDLIVQGEHISKDNQYLEKTYFYRSVILPPGTQTDHLQSHLTQDGHLQIEVPFIEYIPKN